MDLQRSGQSVESLTEQEKDRVENENRFLRYLDVLKPKWIKKDVADPDH